MSWLNEIQWFLLLVIVMKVLILGAVAAWVVTVIAERPCPNYCVYLTPNGRDLAVQPLCDCIYSPHPNFYDILDESSLFHQPANFLPAPEYLYSHPFSIFNPVVYNRPNYITNLDLITPESSRPPSSLRRHNSEISVNNARTTRNGQEAGVEANNQRPSAPLYLDMNINSEDTRSTSRSTITAEERDAIARGFTECADLHALIFAKKREDLNVKKESPKAMSTAELKKMINEKCSEVSKVVEENFNEVKNSRPKKISTASVMKDKEQQDNEMSNKSFIKNKQTLCTTTSEGDLQVSAHWSENTKIEINEPTWTEKQTTTIQNDIVPEESTDKVNAISGITPTNAALTLTTIPKILKKFSETDGVTKIQDIEGISTKNAYSLHTKPVNLQHTSQTTPKSSTVGGDTIANIIAKEQPNLENQGSERKVPEINNEESKVGSASRSQYNEGEIPLSKIITHEYSNNTVQSYINGTEEIPNGDFNDELEDTKNSNEAVKSSKDLTASQDITRETAANTDNASEGDISGNLYFLFNSHQIPARFVQNNNGSLHVGVDGTSICNTLTDNEDHSSTLLTTICNCYKSGSCAHKKID